MTRRSPSRIYAGNEPLPPVEPLVPVALTVVLLGVWWLRSFFVRVAVAHESRGVGDAFGEAALEVGASRGGVSTALAFLLIGAAVCFAVLVRIRWRGRGVWGQVPLAYGMGVATYALVLASWLTFDPEDGTLTSPSRMLEAMPFDAKVVLAACGVAFGLLATALVSRRWCTRGAPAASIACVALLAIPAAFAVVDARGLDPAATATDSIDLPVADVEFASRVYPRLDVGALVYFRWEDEWWVTRVPGPEDEMPPAQRSSDSASSGALMPELRAEASALWGVPSGGALVMMPGDARAATLTEVVDHARRVAPDVEWLELVGRSSHDPPIRLRSDEGGVSVVHYPWEAWLFLPLSVEPAERSVVVAVERGADGLAFVPEDRLERGREADRRTDRGRDIDDAVGVTIVLEPTLTVQELASLAEELYWRQGFEVVSLP